MTFQPGQSGNPSGRNHFKPWLDALKREAEQPVSVTDRRTKLRAVAEKVYELALEGEQWAAQEIANRLDGKPTESVNLTANINAVVLQYGEGDAASWIDGVLGKPAQAQGPLIEHQTSETVETEILLIREQVAETVTETPDPGTQHLVP